MKELSQTEVLPALANEETLKQWNCEVLIKMDEGILKYSTDHQTWVDSEQLPFNTKLRMALQWYEDIPSQGVLCEVYNSDTSESYVLKVIINYDESRSKEEGRFQDESLNWNFYAKPASLSMIGHLIIQ